MAKKTIESGTQIRKNKVLKRYIDLAGSNKVPTLDKSPSDKSPSDKSLSDKSLSDKSTSDKSPLDKSPSFDLCKMLQRLVRLKQNRAKSIESHVCQILYVCARR